MTMTMMTRMMMMRILLLFDPVYGTYRSEREGKDNTCISASAYMRLLQRIKVESDIPCHVHLPSFCCVVY